MVDEIRRCQTEKRRRRRGFICCPDLKRRHPIRFKVASFSVGRDEKKTDSHTLRRRKFQAPHAKTHHDKHPHTQRRRREKREPHGERITLLKPFEFKLKRIFLPPPPHNSLREPSSCVYALFFLSLSLSLYIIVLENAAS